MNKGYTLHELVTTIRQIVSGHPTINSFIEGVYKAIEVDNINYPALMVTVNSTTRTARTLNYDINLLYADRLTDERDNKLFIQSAGTAVLAELLNAIDLIDDVSLSESNQISVFEEQFADNTAGAFVRIQIETANPIGDCAWIDYSCIGC